MINVLDSVSLSFNLECSIAFGDVPSNCPTRRAVSGDEESISIGYEVRGSYENQNGVATKQPSSALLNSVFSLTLLFILT